MILDTSVLDGGIRGMDISMNNISYNHNFIFLILGQYLPIRTSLILLISSLTKHHPQVYVAVLLRLAWR